MFGHDNISWTPINNLLMSETQLFNAGTLAPPGYDEEFVIISEIHSSYVIVKNQDGSRYDGQTHGVGDNNPASVAEAISSAIYSLPSGVYYKIEGDEDTAIDYAILCPSLNREITDISGGSRIGVGAEMTYWNEERCGKCLSGFQEPGEDCSPSKNTTAPCNEACIPIDETEDQEGQEGSNFALIGGIAVAALAFFII